MKHKPILLKKLTGERYGKGREVIGLIGTHHGVGVTHTGLMLAFYMGEELGKKTALIEYNKHHDFNLIQNTYEWNTDDKNRFTFHRIACWKDMRSERMSEVFNEDYECILLDCGMDFTTIREEFLRCDKKIVIGGRSEWDRQKLIRFVKASEEIRVNQTWFYFIPQANNLAISKIKNEIQRKVYAVPTTEEPTRPSGESNRFFEKFF